MTNNAPAPTSRPSDSERFAGVVAELRKGRGDILRDWVYRVRENRSVQSKQELSDPLLLDHVPQLFDSVLDRLEHGSPRFESEQLAAIHGFQRRADGYDVTEAVLELFMFRRAIWGHLSATEQRRSSAYLVMEMIDGLLDRAVMASLESFLDPGARTLNRRSIP
ncbi:MAG: RsbRD N-terminal domain-containing protein [Longimicrobiaceae bacterium]